VNSVLYHMTSSCHTLLICHIYNFQYHIFWVICLVIAIQYYIWGKLLRLALGIAASIKWFNHENCHSAVKLSRAYKFDYAFSHRYFCHSLLVHRRIRLKITRGCRLTIDIKVEYQHKWINFPLKLIIEFSIFKCYITAKL
jgi:hypothetical protein